MPLKVAGVLVCYSHENAPQAVNKFRDILESLSDVHTLRVVSNNKSLNIGDILGTNTNAEFSGWDEGLAALDLDSVDTLILANDTFCTRRNFGKGEIYKLRESLALCHDNKNPYIAGEICWSINFQELKKRKKCLLRWVRSSIFVMPPSAIKKLATISLPDIKSKPYVTLNDKLFAFHESVPSLFGERIKLWLTPSSEQKVWYKADNVSQDQLLLKAKCVLQEMYLTMRCEELSIRVYDWDANPSWKIRLFGLIYWIQSRLLESDP